MVREDLMVGVGLGGSWGGGRWVAGPQRERQVQQVRQVQQGGRHGARSVWRAGRSQQVVAGHQRLSCHRAA